MLIKCRVKEGISEIMQPSGRGYDHGITTFSPDGRLFQVEYARESVKRGTTTAGLKFKDGVVLVCDKSCLLYTSPSPRDATLSRMPSSA